MASNVSLDPYDSSQSISAVESDFQMAWAEECDSSTPSIWNDACMHMVDLVSRRRP